MKRLVLIPVVLFVLAHCCWNGKAQARTLEVEQSDGKKPANRGSKPQLNAGKAATATLVVESDATCNLRIDGVSEGSVLVGVSRLKVTPGRKIVNCVSLQELAAVFEAEVEATRGAESVVHIALADKALGIWAERAAALERELLRTKPTSQEQAVSKMSERLRVVSESVLLDVRWDLHWQRRNKTGLSTWAEATAFCRSLGKGWRLPTVDQLRSLFDRDLPRTYCGSQSCNISDRLLVSHDEFWSSEVVSWERWSWEPRVWIVSLLHGGSRKANPENGTEGSTLCVRSSGWED